MNYKVKVTLKQSQKQFEYELKGNPVESFTCFDKSTGKDEHPKEVADEFIRESNNNLLLQNSPIWVLKPGQTGEMESVSYHIEITCEG